MMSYFTVRFWCWLTNRLNTLIGWPLSPPRYSAQRWRVTGIGLLVVSTAIAGPTNEYVHSSKFVYDAARVVGLREFAAPSLMETFRRFIADHCVDRSLARLTIAASDSDLMKVMNMRLPEGARAGISKLIDLDRTLLGADLEQSSIAQVWCVAGNATAFVRTAGKISRYHLRGSSSARDILPGGLALTLVGFSMTGQGTGNLNTEVRVFARTHSLPTKEVAQQARARLEEIVRTPTFLFLRTDDHFFDCGGPRSDPFAQAMQPPSTDQFLSAPFVVCWPGGDLAACRIVSSHAER